MSKKSSLITRNKNQLDWKVIAPFLTLFVLLIIGFITFVLAIPNNESLNRFKNFEENSNSSNSSSQSSQPYSSLSSSSTISSSSEFGIELKQNGECKDSIYEDVVFTKESGYSLERGTRGCFYAKPGNDNYFFSPKLDATKQVFMYDTEGVNVVTISTDYTLGKIDPTINAIEIKKGNYHITTLFVRGKNITVKYDETEILKL